MFARSKLRVLILLCLVGILYLSSDEKTTPTQSGTKSVLPSRSTAASQQRRQTGTQDTDSDNAWKVLFGDSTSSPSSVAPSAFNSASSPPLTTRPSIQTSEPTSTPFSNMKLPARRFPPTTTRKPTPTLKGDPTSILRSEFLEHAALATAESETPLDIVVHFGGESVSPDHLARLMEAVERNDDPLGIIPQWNESLRLTLRSVQKHILCPPRKTSQLAVRTVYVLLSTVNSMPNWASPHQLDTGTVPSSCDEERLGSVAFRFVTHKKLGGAGAPLFNPYAFEVSLARAELAPHFLYVPAGTVFTGPIHRHHLFERIDVNNDETPILVPLPLFSRDVTGGKKTTVPGSAKRFAATNAKIAEMLFDVSSRALDSASKPSAMFGVHVVNTHLFRYFATGSGDHTMLVGKDSVKLSSNVSKVAAQEKRSTIAVAGRSVSSLLLYTTLLDIVRETVLGRGGVGSGHEHLNIHYRLTSEGVAVLKKMMDQTASLTSAPKGAALPLSVRLISTWRGLRANDTMLIHEAQKAFQSAMVPVVELLNLTDPIYGGMEKTDLVRPPLLFGNKTLQFPPPQDGSSSFPCGRMRVRRGPSRNPLPSPNTTISDLIYPEAPPTQDRTGLILPSWDFTANKSSLVSPATLVSMMCWFPGRPPHALPDEVPEVTAVPTLSQRINREFDELLGEHEEETSENHTVKHQRLATVDMVYTYVKGDAPKWLKEMHKAEKRTSQHEDDQRIRDWDELKYSLRSLERFACRNGDCCGQESGLGIGAIYIVAASEEHVPDWMANYKVGTDGMDEERAAMSEEDKKRCRPPLRIIPHRLIYPGAGNNPLMGEHTKNETLQAEFLPTFNSHGIESVLHRIPGLRKHFIYLNNDYLFGRNVSVGDFYRPIMTNNRSTPMLEPLVPIESIILPHQHHSVGVVETDRPTEDDLVFERELFDSDPEKYAKCRDWPIRRGIKEAVQGELYDTINPWSMTLMYNLHLIHDRLEGFPMNRRHSHVPMLFDRDIMQRMQEVDFADVSYTTRKSKFRATNNIATEFMYIYYAGAHRRERGTLDSPTFCARLEHHQQYPQAAIVRLYREWNHGEHFIIDKQWRKNEFFQIGKKVVDGVAMNTNRDVVDLNDTIAALKNGTKETSTFMAVNDDFPTLSDEEFVETREQFRELMNLLVRGSVPSSYEKKI